MIPAMINCPNSYTKEYDGYTLCQKTRAMDYCTEFVCVDKAMQAARGTNANTDGALMYHVEVDCGSDIEAMY